MESLENIGLNRAPHMRYREPLGSKAESMRRALAFFQKVTKGADNDLARSLALEREFICDAHRILFAPYQPAAKGSRPPNVLPGDITGASVFFLGRCPRPCWVLSEWKRATFGRTTQATEEVAPAQ